MKNMTADQLLARLAELKAHQATYEGRNLDAELLTLMQSGGDVDALEGQTLEPSHGLLRFTPTSGERYLSLLAEKYD
ncbi:MAG: hypothetical protein ACTJG9_08740 [Alcaligenes aquatilis]